MMFGNNGDSLSIGEQKFHVQVHQTTNTLIAIETLTWKKINSIESAEKKNPPLETNLCGAKSAPGESIMYSSNQLADTYVKRLMSIEHSIPI